MNAPLKVMIILGTRPEAIKLAPVYSSLKQSPHFEPVLTATGQHREMLAQALDQFGLVPDFNLDIMKPDQRVSDVAVESLQRLEQLISREQPGLVLVQGDTTTAFAGCLAAFYQQVAAGHVEAGLRTYQKFHPFPEEINRSLITRLADLHFVPTSAAGECLRREGISDDRISITGNTVIDALRHVISPTYRFASERLRRLNHDRRLLVVTSHRRENFGEPLENICRSVSELVALDPDIEVVFSVHHNPKVQATVHRILDRLERIHLVEPLGYGDMANLLARCHLALTDSGGLQEEAPALGKPVLVLRETTERPEAVEAGLSRLVGTSQRAIVSAALELLGDESSYAAMARGLSPYGDGKAASRIVDSIAHWAGYIEEAPQPFEGLIPAAISATPTKLSDEDTHGGLDELLEDALRAGQSVSVVTLDLGDSDERSLPQAASTIAKGLRTTDTIAGREGRHLVLVLPGAGPREAASATRRLKRRFGQTTHRRRSGDDAGGGLSWRLRVHGIRTYDRSSPHPSSG